MSLTEQQQKVIDTIKRDDVHLVKTEACAGSGKTHTLVALTKELNPKSGIYLAYNKSIAVEAQEKFKGTNVTCSTIHSMAYRATVNQYGLKVGFFGVRDVLNAKMKYKDKQEIVSIMEEFLLSEYTDVEDFFDNKPMRPIIQAAIRTHLDKMANGEMVCSHSFYLKMYHILLVTGAIKAPETDLLLLDEFGDITPITLDIFKTIKADKKIAVGDAQQNIYSFNNTINGFHALEGEGESVPLTQSFRVSNTIAPYIEKYCKTYLDPDYEFTGREYKDYTVSSKAYIARNNSGLVNEMFYQMKLGVEFNVTRSIDIILELPLILANLGNGKKITLYKYKAVEKLRSEWEKDPMIQAAYNTVNSYVRTMMATDQEIQRGFDVVREHGPSSLNSLAAYVRKHSTGKQFLTLTTAHSSKGLEFSEVEIAEDLNDMIAVQIVKITDARRLLARHPNSEYQQAILDAGLEELRIGYVAVSRAMVSLKNAKFLSIGVN